ncbi:RNA polymerase II transcription factor B subunit 1 [Naganishia albida]|nr:RNA polymerase II transcription factor B subunit 1 [Naganishia albida]
MTTRYKTIYNKVPGTLVLTETTLAWTPDEQNAEVVRNQQLSRVITMFTSKAGAKKTSLKLEFENNVPKGGLTFQFTATPPNDVSERQQVQDFLVPIIAKNKERVLSGIAQTTDAEAGIKAGAAALVESVGKDGRPVKTSTPSGRAVDVAKILPGTAPSSRAGTPSRPTPPGTPVPATGTDQTIPGGLIGPSLAPFAIQLKQSVLRKHPNLLSLHRQLVIEKLVTEAEFWDGREHLLEQERLLSTQQPGRSSQLLDDRFGFTQQAKARAERERKAKIVGTGFGIAQGSKKGAGAGVEEELKIQVTKELQREIFEEFPITQRIYAENVGGEDGMTEADFWSRYFRSRLWDRHRASVRAQGASGLQKVDPVFDRYLEEPDDDVEPKHAPSRAVDLFLDLAATEEDHGQTGNERDVTMQPGRQRGTLPLIRRFNEHSNRLVAQDEEIATMSVDPEHMGSAQKRLYSEIELEDLQGETRERVIELDVQERQSFFDTKGSAVQDDMQEFVGGRSTDEIRKIISSTHHELSHWTPHLDRVIPAVPPGHPGANSGTVAVREDATQDGYQRAKKTAEEAIRSVADALISEEERAAQTEPIPDGIMSQASTCHNAACEFLRQFWSAVLPTPQGTLGGAQTPEQKAAKAKKMATFLAGTQKKVESVVASAVNAGMKEPSRVRDALAPTLDAVNKALDQYASMK